MRTSARTRHRRRGGPNRFTGGNSNAARPGFGDHQGQDSSPATGAVHIWASGDGFPDSRRTLAANRREERRGAAHDLGLPRNDRLAVATFADYIEIIEE